MVSQDAGESKDWRVVEKNGAEGGRNDQYDTHEGLDGVYREGIETTSEPDVSRLLSLIECRGLFLSSAECRAPLPVHGDERRTMPSGRRDLVSPLVWGSRRFRGGEPCKASSRCQCRGFPPRAEPESLSAPMFHFLFAATETEAYL